jgi:hypothetical protein
LKLQLISVPPAARSALKDRVTKYEQQHQQQRTALQKQKLLARAGPGAVETVERVWLANRVVFDANATMGGFRRLLGMRTAQK